MGNLPAHYEQDVQQLRRLVDAGHRGLRKLSSSEIRRFDTAYRRVSVLLSQVRTRTQDPELVRYLNNLVARAHSLLTIAGHRSESKMGWGILLEFARVVSRTWKFHAIAAALFFFGAAMAYHAVLTDPMAAYAIMPAGETRLPGTTRDQLLADLRHGRDDSSAKKLAFSSLLVSNNTRVGLLCMVSGAAGGVPTVFLTIYNGMILGAFTATHVRAGIHDEFWTWILPHGVPEIWALILLSGMGLRIGAAMIAPGRQTRSQALTLAGQQAMTVALGAAVMLLCAAIIESYIRQSHLPSWSRYTIAGAGAVFLTAYFSGGAWIERRETRLARLGVKVQP